MDGTGSVSRIWGILATSLTRQALHGVIKLVHSCLGGLWQFACGEKKNNGGEETEGKNKQTNKQTNKEKKRNSNSPRPPPPPPPPHLGPKHTRHCGEHESPHKWKETMWLALRRSKSVGATAQRHGWSNCTPTPSPQSPSQRAPLRPRPNLPHYHPSYEDRSAVFKKKKKTVDSYQARCSSADSIVLHFW